MTARVAVNPPLRESLLVPLSRDALSRAVGEAALDADSPQEWERETFTSRQGHELWRPLLLGALLLLLLESWMAASGGPSRSERSEPTSDPKLRRAPHA